MAHWEIGLLRHESGRYACVQSKVEAPALYLFKRPAAAPALEAFSIVIVFKACKHLRGKFSDVTAFAVWVKNPEEAG